MRKRPGRPFFNKRGHEFIIKDKSVQKRIAVMTALISGVSMSMAKKIILATLLFIGWCCFADQASAGFGVSPYLIRNHSLLPGSVFSADYQLSRSVSGSETPIRIEMFVENEEMRTWISSDLDDQKSLSEETIKIPVKVTIRVPADASLGDYKTKINFRAVAADEQPGFAAQLGISSLLDLKVIEERIRDLSVDNIRFPKVSAEDDLLLSMRLLNDGNTVEGPTKVLITVKDLLKKTVISEIEVSDFAEVAAPFEKKIIEHRIRHSLPIGYYWADVRIFWGDNKIAESVVPLEILSPEVITQESDARQKFPAGKLGAWLIGGVVCLGFAVIFAYLFKRRKGEF